MTEIQMINLEINKVPLSVPKGTTIMEAAEKLRVSIPHFCWHPGLSIAGVCRFCMVKIDGMPKLQIACNTTCAEGMKVFTETDEVKEAHKWALEFHLINHPLDCPICDQAGECGLQNYYMKVGKYTSQMVENKVLKPKALDVGDTLVLDTERCILCSRCVRFEDEITKTSSLGIFNRGDHAVIGTYPGRRITHNYSYNIVDICPVGAFTAKDFRFKCRVWFLKETETVCPGCSTGCNVTLFENKNQREYYRLKPRYNKEVNGHWMCDYGRTMFEHLNAKARRSEASRHGEQLAWSQVAGSIKSFISKANSASFAVVLTPQYTNEEYDFLFQKLKDKNPKFFIWRDLQEKSEDFDGMLMRGDKNPNTKGLQNSLAKAGVLATEIRDLSELKSFTSVMVFGPEVETAYPSLNSDLNTLSNFGNGICYFGNSLNESTKKFLFAIPTLTFAEKTGTFTNFNNITQSLKSNPPVFVNVKKISELFDDNNAEVRSHSAASSEV